MKSRELGSKQRQRVRESFSAQGLMTSMAARIEALEAGTCTLEAPVQPAFSQQHGFAHAAASFALGDVACGYAALSMLDEDQEVLTSEMKIHLLAPAKGTHLIARAEVIRPGRRLMITRADVFARAQDGSESHVATLLGTIVPVPRG